MQLQHQLIVGRYALTLVNASAFQQPGARGIGLCKRGIERLGEVLEFSPTRHCRLLPSD